jgi:alkylresorcinol/alkylpyrone synthase
MSNVKSVGTSLPEFSYASSDIIRGAKNWLMSSSGEFELFERFVSSSKIARRHFGVPLEQILSGLSVHDKAEIFTKVGVDLGVKAIRNCLKSSQIDLQDIESLIFTSCSLPVIPSIDAHIIQNMDLPLSIKRIPIYQHGCVGGAAALGLAGDLSETLGHTLIVSVELCSLVYQGSDLTPGNLVGSALFGDGGAAVLVSPGQGRFQINDNRSDLLPSSYELMGYDLQEDGAHLRLKKELPGELARLAPQKIRDFLASNDLNEGDVAHWLIHPGGVKILNFLETEFKLSSERSRYSWDVLEKYGNMSSASILFVIDEFIQARRYKSGDRVMVIGIGPGLTLEQILVEIKE